MDRLTSIRRGASPWVFGAQGESGFRREIARFFVSSTRVLPGFVFCFSALMELAVAEDCLSIHNVAWNFDRDVMFPKVCPVRNNIRINKGGVAVKPKAVLAYCREKGIKAVDLRFPDIGGNWKHITFPVSALTEGVFDSGFGQELTLRGISHESREQMVLIPISNANYLDPLIEQPTLVILASIQDAMTREESWLDSRAVASRALEYLKSTGIADDVEVRACQPFLIHHVPRGERSERGGGESEPVPSSQRFLSCGPSDADFGFRCELTTLAAEAGVGIERHYRGQRASSEVVLAPSNLIETCDNLMMIRYMIDQLAAAEEVSLVPTALACSTQWGLIRNSETIFSGSYQQGVSDIGWYAIGGVLKHATALAALALATHQFSPTMEYRWLRMVSSSDPDAICNVIFGSHNPRSRAIEFRGTPSISNPYIHLAAVMMAMIDGIQNKYPGTVSVDAGSGRDGLSVAGGEGGIPDPRRLSQSLIEDRDFLLYGDVFSEGLLDLLTEFLSLDR